MACVQYIIGIKTDSLKNFKKSLAIQRSILKEGIYNGIENQSNKCFLFKYSITLCNLGYIQLMTKRGISSAVISFESAVTRQQIVLKKDNSFLLSTIEYLAMANIRKGQIENALKLYNRLLQIYIENLGPLHPKCVLILSKISLINLSQSKLQLNLSFIEEAKEQLSKKDDARPFSRLLNVLGVCNLLRRDVIELYYENV